MAEAAGSGCRARGSAGCRSPARVRRGGSRPMSETHEHELPFIRKYIFSMDHKIIGIQFLFMSLLFMIVGGFLAMIVRWQLGFRDKEITIVKYLPESLNLADSMHYNAVFTMHASIMIFAVIIPILTGAFGNYLIPLMI